jgi:hypothetical protein
MKRYWIGFILWVLVSSLALAQMPVEDEMFAYILGIEGRTHLGRNEFIKGQLHKMGIGYVAAPFKKITVVKKDTTIIEGENIIVRIGEGSKRIVVGAHYDSFIDSPGANDNGSGVAVLLALINHMEGADWNYTVDFCFFDQEEPGSIGAIYYIKQFVVPKLHLAMINLDIEGSGDEIFVGPVGRYNRLLMRYIYEASKKTGYSLVDRPVYPGSDHDPFRVLQLENIGISVVPKGDADKLVKFVQNGYKADSIDMPKVMGVMHTVDDRSNFVSHSSLKMSYEFTKTLLLLLNESRK